MRDILQAILRAIAPEALRASRQYRRHYPPLSHRIQSLNFEPWYHLGKIDKERFQKLPKQRLLKVFS